MVFPTGAHTVHGARRPAPRKPLLRTVRGSTSRVMDVRPIPDITYEAVRVQEYVYVTVTSSLSGRIYYHWYLNGQYKGATLTRTKAFRIRIGDDANVLCIDTNAIDFDPVLSAPDVVSDRITVYWVRSLDTDVTHYIIQQNKDGGGWTDIGKQISTGAWQYEFITDRLVDLATYQYRVVPYDAAGNAGTPITFTAEKHVRVPDSPDWTSSYSAGTTRFTFSAVA